MKTLDDQARAGLLYCPTATLCTELIITYAAVGSQSPKHSSTLPGIIQCVTRRPQLHTFLATMHPELCYSGDPCVHLQQLKHCSNHLVFSDLPHISQNGHHLQDHRDAPVYSPSTWENGYHISATTNTRNHLATPRYLFIVQITTQSV